ncbi:MAG: beta-ketoacyl-ACP synthase III [bacterium]
MTSSSLHRATITGLGVYVPPAVLTNDELARRLDTSDEWITTRTGIKRRHLAGPDQATSDLGIIAARAALDEAGVDAEDLDLIVVGTATPDALFPATACLLQNRLGASRAGAFDLLAACSSFVYGLNTAGQLIATGAIRTALVVGAETLSRLVDWNDRRTAVLIGDGAAAAVLQPSLGSAGFYSGVVGANGAAGEMIKLPAGGSRIPVTSEVIERNLHRAYMDGQAVFKLAVRTIPGVIRAAVERAGWTLDDIDLVVPHQANLRIIDAMAEQLNIPRDRFFVNIQEYGNTSAASVPLALYEARQSGRLSDGDRIVMAAFGGGFTYAACTMRWGR